MENKKENVNTENGNLSISDVINSYSDKKTSYEDEFITMIKRVDKKFQLLDLYKAYKTASIRGHFQGAGNEIFDFIKYIKDNYL